MEHVTTLVLVLQDMLEPGMCEHIYAPMSTIKQSLEVVMSGQVETLRVSFNSVEWQLGNTPHDPTEDLFLYQNSKPQLPVNLNLNPNTKF